MEQSKRLNSFFLTLIFHAIILFGVKNQIVLDKGFLMEQVESPPLKIALQEQLLVQKKIVPLPKASKVSKKVVQEIKHREVTPNLAQAEMKRDPFELKEIEQYALELRAFIERHKFYPRMAKRMKQTGDVEVKLVVSQTGFFEKITFSRSSRFPLLNDAAKELIEKLKKFKPLPQSLAQKSFAIPIQYKL